MSSNRLRIAHILPSLGLGGAEVMAAHLMSGLAVNHDVCAIGLYPSRNSEVERRITDAGVHVVHLGKKGGFDLRMFPALSRVLREFQPDVLHTHLSVLRYVLPVLAHRPVRLAVHTLHNAAEREADGIGKLVQRLAFAKTVAPIAISRDGAETFERVYGRSCAAIVPNCIPVEEFQRPPEIGTAWRRRAGFAESDVLLLCVGRLDEQKDPLGLISAFAAVRHANARLLLVGEGTLLARVEALVAAMGLQESVHLLGSRNDISDCLAAADIFVLASRWEGSPLAVMEAMASQVPVISTAVGGVPELIDHGRNGLLVSPGNLGELTRSMESLTVNPQLRRAMGTAARAKAVKEFAVQSMTQRYELLYRSLLDRAPETHAKPWVVQEPVGAGTAEHRGQ